MRYDNIVSQVGDHPHGSRYMDYKRDRFGRSLCQIAVRTIPEM